MERKSKMKCAICEGKFKKSKLIYSFGYAYCPICGENIGRAKMYIQLIKQKGQKLCR